MILVLESKAGKRGTRIRVSVALRPMATISARLAAARRVSADCPSLRRALFLRKGMNERLYAIAADLQVLVSGTLRASLRYDNYFDLRFAARASLPATGSRRADTPMPVRESEALILRSFPLGEADRLVSFLRRTEGRMRGVASGARRPKSRFGSTLQLFSYVQFWFDGHATRALRRLNQSQCV